MVYRWYIYSYRWYIYSCKLVYKPVRNYVNISWYIYHKPLWNWSYKRTNLANELGHQLVSTQ